MKQILNTLGVIALFCVGVAHSLAPTPLTFGSGSATEEQRLWDELLKYKLFGKSSLTFAGNNITITEKSGFTGTMGNMSMNNNNHYIKGPVVVGGNLSNADMPTTFDSGYVRVGGALNISGNSDPSQAKFKDSTCVGSITNQAKASFAKGLQVGGVCPTFFPPLETSLTIPTLPGNPYGVATWFKMGGTLVVDGRPNAGDKVRDIYLDQIQLQNGANLLIRQDSTGGLTRVFVNSFNLDATAWQIGITYDGTTMISKDQYHGSLLFYTPNSISVAAGSDRWMMGTYVSSGDITVQQGMKLAGQFIAENVSVNAGFNSAEFKYVPFDPPTLDPTTLAYGTYDEAAGTQPIAFRLDKAATIDVTFRYFIKFHGPGVGEASAADFSVVSPTDSLMSVLVTIPKGEVKPTVDPTVTLFNDTFNEPDEKFYVVVWDLTGAVLPGNLDSKEFPLSILASDLNAVPVAVRDSFATNEDQILTKLATSGVLVNDSDADGDVLTATILVTPIVHHGSLTLNTNGSFTYVPDANWFGKEVFAYQVDDGHGGTAIDSLVILVQSVNDAPVSTPIPDQTILEGGAFTNIVLDNYVTDVETPDASIIWTKTGGSKLTTTITARVASIAIPSADWNGIDTVIFTATDANGASFKDTVIFTVTPVNDAPIAVTDTFPATEGYNYKIDKLLENDTDVDNLHAELHVSKVWGGVNGTATLLSNDSVLFQPLDYNFNGEASFYYQLSDGAGGLDTALVVVNYAPVNDQPVAKNKTMSLPSWIEDVASITLPFSTVMTGDNDSLDGNAPSTLSLVSVLNDASVVGGTVAIVGSNVVFTPAANFNGNAKFQYVIQDAGTPLPALKDTAWVTLVILPVNDAPVITGQAAVSTAEETAKVITLGMLTVTDVDNTYPTGFSLRVGSGSNYTVSGTTITPALDFVGTLTVPVRVFDGTDSSNVFNLSVTVTNVNDAPVITAQTAVTTPEETAKAITLAMLTVTDVDNVYPTGFTYRVGTGTNYTVSGTTITPVLNYVGTLTVPVRIFDGTDSSNVFNLSVTVTNVNDAPVITAQTAVTTPEETPKAITLAMLTATDIDNIYPTDFTLRVGTGTNYTVSGTTITPVLNFVGTLTVPVRIFDGTDSSNIFNLSVTVTPVNDAPVVVDHSYSTLEDTRLDIAAPGLKMGGTDVENDAFTTVLVTPPAHGTVTVAADGSFSYMPSKDYNGDDSFTYAGKDADLGVAATVTINMIPVNEPPVATADAYTTAEDVVLNENVTTNDFDVDGFAFAVALVSDVAHGTLVLNPNGSFSYTPAANYNGSDSFTYQLSDAVGSIDTNIVTVSLTVTPVNDAPVALVPSAYAVNEDEVLQVSAAQGLLFGAVDEEGDALTAALVSGATHGVVALLADGSFTYTPEKDFNGMDSFQFVANDGIANSVPVTVTIAVAAVNDAPVIAAQTFSVPEDAVSGTIIGKVLASDVDSGSVLSYSLSEPSSLFTIGVDGTIRLIGALDYEAMTSSTLSVVVSDGLSSAQATITVAVTNVQETSVVQIISVFANDSNWLAPEKVWTNDSLVDLTWSHDGEVVTERIAVNLGVNVIIREFKSTSKDTYGRDTVTIYVSRQTPVVDLVLPPDRPVPTPGTVIEEPPTTGSSSSDASASSSSSALVIDDTKPIFYINKTETEIFGQVIYINKDLQLDTMRVKLDPKLTEGVNVVDYSWTDPFGNIVTTSVNVFLDLTAPLVKIVRPADSTIVRQYVAPIVWTVDGHVMDTLNLQSLVVGWNLVIRTYRDRAGNEGSDSIWIQLKDEKKTINISLEDPLVLLNPVKIAEMYAVNPPKDDEFFALSIFNPKTGQEEEKQYGMGTKVTIGDDSEPYPGLSGKHLGPTIRVDAKLPPMGGVDAAGNRRGGDLASIMEPDGSVALTAGAGEDRVMVSLQDYIADHCLADAFKGIPDDQLKNAPLYKALVKVDISIYDAIGQFVDQMGVSQNIEKSDYLNDAASVTMFLELKPHNGQGLRNQRGREYATGVYVLRGAVKSTATLLCDTPNASRGAKTNYTSEILENFGFRRP